MLAPLDQGCRLGVASSLVPVSQFRHRGRWQYGRLARWLDGVVTAPYRGIAGSSEAWS